MPKRAANGHISESESTPKRKRARRGDPPPTNNRIQEPTEDEEYGNENGEGAHATSTQGVPRTQVQRDLALGDDEAFEDKYRERIQREIENKGAKRLLKVGEIAEYGIIERIELVNFMCHIRTTVNLGPQINFVVGQNGSGKSAVLSGIAVALGGRAASTGRGTGLKNFIREGEDVAEVTITLKNEGLGSYRPDVYGDAIQITRRFNDKGSSSYIIKGARDKYKKTISNKREELTNITDHMNLQIDNPVVVLTQDTSRQFLASSKANDKYQFFLNGTLLTQLSDEYASIFESLKKTETILTSKQTVVPELKRQFTEAQTRYREAQAAQHQHQRMTDLEHEIAWAYMKDKKAQMEVSVVDHETAKRTVEKARGLVETAKAELNKAEAEVTAAGQQGRAEDNAGNIEEQRKTLRQELKSKKNKLTEVKIQKTEMNTALQQCNTAIEGLAERITEEEAKLQDGRHELREKLNLDMERMQKQVKIEENNVSDCQTNITNLVQLVQAKRREYDEVKASREKLRTDITTTQRSIQGLTSSQKNKINLFGTNLDRALVDIARGRWHGRTPMGPLGQYVELKDPRWAPLMRVNLGNLMSGFAVTDSRDREPLSKILKRHGNQSVNILVGEVDLFDFSRGEPPAHILTPLRVLNIKDEWVVRLLINSAHIERTCITNTRAEAQQLLESVPGISNVLSADLMRSQKYPDGGFFTSALRRPWPDDRSNWYFKNADLAESVRLEQEKLSALEQEYANVNPKLAEIETEGRKSNAKAKELQKLESGIRQKLFKLRDELARLNEQADEEAPASLQGLHEARKEEEERKQSIIAQFTAVAEREATLNSELKPLVEQLDEIRRKAEHVEKRNRENKGKLEPLLEQRLLAVKRLEHYQGKLEKAQTESDQAAQAENIVVEEYETWYAAALKISEPVDTDRSPGSIKADIERLKKALRESERRHGQSIEEIAQEVQSTQDALNKVQKEFTGMKSFIRGLRLAMGIRIDSWHAFRKHISLRTKQHFSYYLGQRGYRGTIDFDHTAHTLDLRIITDESNPNAKDKDPRALSGGEKSFSTICLLMSLWESVGCPIRCLDEFDVFMDQVNRHIAMQAMVQTARASDNSQYIIITPLGVNPNFASGVRIHKMADPERGQTTLNL